MDVRGGNGGYSNTGGGSGGIISLHYQKSLLLFETSLNSGYGNRASSGFLFLKHTDGKSSYSKLVLKDGSSQPAYLVCDRKVIDIQLDEIYIVEGAKLSMLSCDVHSPMILITTKLTGDKSGWLVVHESQDVYVAQRQLSLDTQVNIEVKENGAIDVPSSLVITKGTVLTVAGSLAGVKNLTVAGTFRTQFPGHSGYKIAPVMGVSYFDFKILRVKNNGRIETTTAWKTHIRSDVLEKDFGATVQSNIYVIASKQISDSPRQNLKYRKCPRHFEVFEWASETLYNPCLVENRAKHVWKMSNESYIVTLNVSRLVNVTVWKNLTINCIVNSSTSAIVNGSALNSSFSNALTNVSSSNCSSEKLYLENSSSVNGSFVFRTATENGSYRIILQESFLEKKIVYALVNETRFNITFYIACNSTDLVLYTGQSCYLPVGNHSYNSFEIRGGGALYLEAGSRRDDKSTLSISKLAVRSGGNITAINSNFPNPANTVGYSGGSYGGHGGPSGGPETSGSIYGNVSAPVDYGSNGGGNTGSAGGVIILHVGELIMDGLVDASGGSASNGVGGGSGGSVFVTSNFLMGQGTFRARGGSCSGVSGGGGGGGRVSIVTKLSNQFEGFYDASGGRGSTVGAAGTVFLGNEQNSYDTMVISHSGSLPSVLPSMLNRYTFDELRIISGGSFLVTTELQVAKLVTDNTGTITVESTGKMFVTDLSELNKKLLCDVVVNSGGFMSLPGQVIFSGPGSPAVSISGVLLVDEAVVEKSKYLRITNNGELRSRSLILHTGSSAQISKQGKIRRTTHSSQLDLYALVLQTNSHLTYLGGNVDLKADIFHLGRSSTFELRTFPKVISVSTNDMTLDSNAQLTVSAGGLLHGVGTPPNRQSGCSHGGQGGGSSTGSTYGSIFEPRHHGCGNTARGGGMLFLNVKKRLILRGKITANGGHSSDGTGGASGGSVYINASTLVGHGAIEADGGDGSHSAGGGGGGRIAVYVGDRSKFKGSITAFGGCAGPCGAAGTIFIQEVLTGLPRNTTVVDSGGRLSQKKTVIMHEQKLSFSIGKLELIRSAKLEVAPVNNNKMKIDVFKLKGDRSGLFIVHGNQTLSLGASKALSTQPFVLPWAMSVASNGCLIVSPKLYIIHTEVSPSMYLAGKLIGGQELVIANKATVVFTQTGIVGTGSDVPGIFSFRFLKVSSGGIFKLGTGNNIKQLLEIRSVTVDVSFGGSIEGSFFKIKVLQLHVGFNGTVKTDGQGHLAGKGPGAGSNQGPSGGSFGGCGGGRGRCQLYGTLFRAEEFGSGGGFTNQQSASGAGGGKMIIETDELILDGIISSNGQDGEGNKVGGGSGGSINLRIIKTFSGRGKLLVSGGDNSMGRAGAGGGGRVSIVLNGESNYQGDFIARGGSGNSQSGSPGTIYISTVREGYRSSKLIVDGRGVSPLVSLRALLNESVKAYDFDELQLYGRITLFLERNMIIGNLLADSNSVIYVQNGVVLILEPGKRYIQPICSFHVQPNGELRLPVAVKFLGSSNVFSGTLSNLFDMTIGEGKRTTLLASARMARFIDGNYTFMTKRGEYRFSSLHVKNGASLVFENSRLKKVPLTVGTLELNYGAVLQGSWLDIRSSDVVIHPGAKMDLAAQGFPTNQGKGAGAYIKAVGTGAGHGGYGGGSTYRTGLWYGSTLNPNATGSGGGSSAAGKGGAGGGFLHLVVVRKLQLNGEISVKGESAPGIDAGGGSGGSVWLSAQNLIGNGLITADGGNGNRNGYGGSGGRMAIYLQEAMGFEGLLTAKGGKTTSSRTEAAGTVYVEDNAKRQSRKYLRTQNFVRSGAKPTTVVSEPGIKDYSFDELTITGSVLLEMTSTSSSKVSARVASLEDDGYGEIAIRNNQTFYVAAKQTVESHFSLRTNILVEEGANFVSSSNVTVIGVSINLKGKLSNVQHLTLESGAHVEFASSSQTALLKDTEILSQSEPGTQQFASIILKTKSTLVLPKDSKLTVGVMRIKKAVTVKARSITIKSQDLSLEHLSVLSVSDSVTSTSGAICMGKASQHGGSGGGHASMGGFGYQGLYPGSSYGSLYRADQPGCRGGDGVTPGSFGRGGGFIHIYSDFLSVYGSIRADGGNAQNGKNGGAGSGGSILVKVARQFSGVGQLSADGGRGDSLGGCGSGGRIAIHVDNVYTFRGNLQALGGVSKTSTAFSGGPGTVYIRDIRGKRPYRQLKIDNQAQGWSKFLTLSENTSFVFDEVYMTNKASLRLANKGDGKLRTLRIAKLYSDGNGLLHVYPRQIVFLEAEENKRTVSKPAINLKVENDGELVMASKSYLGGNVLALELKGTLTGVHDLRLTRNKVVNLYKGAHTARRIGKTLLQDAPSTFKLSSITIYSGSALTMKDETEVKLLVGILNVKYGASFSTHHLKILASTVDIEIGATLSCSGDNPARQAAPSSGTTKLGNGAGAGHASNGGRGPSASGGTYYGSLYKPVLPGLRGGSSGRGTIGGDGGGYISLQTGNQIINDGIITVAAANADPGSVAGGGSGGSLLIRTDWMTGERKVSSQNITSKNQLPSNRFCSFLNLEQVKMLEGKRSLS